ncbi:MAG TPA: hypothetical protein VEF04_23560, partial [Blastocatellia bacterium]|nr:hypothetical protein [Blastocatellia bacterium]
EEAESIGAGEGDRMVCPLTFNPNCNLQRADIAVTVNYKDFANFSHRELYRFSTMRGSDGKLYWFKRPLSRG